MTLLSNVTDLRQISFQFTKHISLLPFLSTWSLSSPNTKSGVERLTRRTPSHHAVPLSLITSPSTGSSVDFLRGNMIFIISSLYLILFPRTTQESDQTCTLIPLISLVTPHLITHHVSCCLLCCLRATSSSFRCRAASPSRTIARCCTVRRAHACTHRAAASNFRTSRSPRATRLRHVGSVSASARACTSLLVRRRLISHTLTAESSPQLTTSSASCRWNTACSTCPTCAASGTAMPVSPRAVFLYKQRMQLASACFAIMPTAFDGVDGVAGVAGVHGVAGVQGEAAGPMPLVGVVIAASAAPCADTD